MPAFWMDVGRYRVPLSSIRGSAKDRAHHLGRPYRDRQPVTCLCCSPGIPMGVALRNETPPIYYLYHLHRGDPALHAPHCPHHIPPAGLAPIPPAPTQVESAAPGPSPVDATPASAAASLAQTLDQLAIGAGLNEWRSSWIDKRTFPRVRTRLLDAANSIQMPDLQQTLGSLLYVPPLWNPAHRDAIERDWQLFVDGLHAESPTPRRAFVLGTVRSLDSKPEWTAPRLQLTSHRAPFWLDETPALLPFPADASHSWLVLLELSPSRSKHRYRVSDAASILLSAQWIPSNTSAHAHLADQMVSEGISFHASLAHDPDTSWAFPDFFFTGPDQHTLRRSPFGITKANRPEAT